jgi:hypothetical protein
MSRLVIPVIGRTLWHTGDILLRADLDLLLRDGAGTWPRRTFRVDSGTEVTTMPAYDAKRLGLTLALAAARGVVHHPTGLELRSGFLRFRVAGMDQTEYAVSCFFLGDPGTAPVAGPAAAIPRRLLQPLALLGQLRFSFDRDAMPSAPYGTMTVEKRPP